VALQLRRVILACGDVIFTLSRQCRSNGRLAQLGEHHVRIVGVVGSNPIPSTKLIPSNLTITATFFELSKTCQTVHLASSSKYVPDAELSIAPSTPSNRETRLCAAFVRACDLRGTSSVHQRVALPPRRRHANLLVHQLLQIFWFQRKRSRFG
jgi:hypothetical protein